MSMLPMRPDNPFAQPIPKLTVDVPQVQMPAAKPRRGGMFGSGLGLGEAIVHALNGYLAGMGNPAGIANMRAIQESRQRQQQTQQEEQQYQRQRTDGWQDWVQREQWKLANGGGDELGQMMRSAGVDPASEQGQTFYRQYLQNKVNPFVAITRQNPDGSEVREFMRPPQAPAAPVGRLTPIDDGGPTASPSGGFPRPF